MTDLFLKQAVLDELAWDPRVNEAHIGVTARDGVVTLTGHVASYAEKCAAEHAASRVSGVRGIAQELQVRYASDVKHGDEDIIKQALNVLDWDLAVPADRIRLKVEKGWITLSGTVSWHFQKEAAEADVRKLFGVMGVSNEITIKPTVQAADVQKRIRAAFHRNAQFEAENIVVSTDGSKVTLSGKVDSYNERTLAEETAWSAPGVTQVNDLMTVN